MKLKKMLKLKLPQLTPERAFLATAATFGLLFVLIIPPFQAPDEPNHFYRAYQVSTFHFLGERLDHVVGGHVPRSFIATSGRFQYLSFQPKQKAHLSNILHELLRPLAPNNMQTVSFANTALYSPLAYGPQALTIGIFGLMRVPPLALMYLARLSILATWLALMYYAMRTIPVGKWALAALALNPMAVFSGGSLSPDAIIMGVVFLMVALIVRELADKQTVTRAALWRIFAVMAALALLKPPYMLLAGLVLLIPIRKFASRKLYFQFMAGSLFLTMTLALGWLLITKGLYYNYRLDFDPVYAAGISPGGQLGHILSHPLSYIHALARAIIGVNGNPLVLEFNGVFGWLDTYLPLWLITASYIVMGIPLALTSPIPSLTWPRRIFIFLLAGLTSISIVTLLYASWNQVGAGIIEGLQGRYFIPLTALLIPLTAGMLVKKEAIANLAVQRFVIVSNSAVLVAALVFVGFRYYI